MWDQSPGTVTKKKKNRKQKPYGCEGIQSWCAVINVNCVVARVIDTVTGMSKKNKNTRKYNVSTKEKTDTNTPIRPHAGTPPAPTRIPTYTPARTRPHPCPRLDTPAPARPHPRAHEHPPTPHARGRPLRRLVFVFVLFWVFDI